jgi:hypothetical protein
MTFLKRVPAASGAFQTAVSLVAVPQATATATETLTRRILGETRIVMLLFSLGPHAWGSLKR